MIETFADAATRDIYNADDTKAARRFPKTIWNVARRKLDQLQAALNISDLRIPPSNNLEALKGDLKGSHSIRINDQFRVVFRWEGGRAHDVRVTDYH